jgi:hypothetical protein
LDFELPELLNRLRTHLHFIARKALPGLEPFLPPDPVPAERMFQTDGRMLRLPAAVKGTVSYSYLT